MSHLVDANILVYAAMRDSPEHAAGRRWLNLASHDSGFQRFSGLRFLDPLA